MDKRKINVTIDKEPLIAMRQNYPMLKISKLIGVFFNWAVENKEQFLKWLEERAKEEVAKDLLCYLSPPQEGGEE